MSVNYYLVLLIPQSKIDGLEKNMRITYKIINQLKNLINIENYRLSTIKNTVKEKRSKLFIHLCIYVHAIKSIYLKIIKYPRIPVKMFE